MQTGGGGNADYKRAVPDARTLIVPVPPRLVGPKSDRDKIRNYNK
jgi:hypothetical protein